MRITESKNLLREMRETGCVLKLKDFMGCTTHARLVGKVIRFAGYGHWACRNSFEDFGRYMKDYTLTEKLPSDFYTWGL